MKQILRHLKDVKEQSEKTGLQLNVKKTKVTTTGSAANFKTGGEDKEIR